MDNYYAILGCGGHARSIADIILNNDINADFIFLDDNAKAEECIFEKRYKVLKLASNTEYLKKAEKIFLGIGENLARKEIVESLSHDLKYKIAYLIDKTAHVGFMSEIGKGTFVASFAHIGPETKIGDGSIINTNAVVEHECWVGDYCHISVNSTICGRCHIGNNVFLGAGAVIKDYISICDNVTIGSGSVVIKDIREPGIYVGNPARKIK